MFSVMSVVCSRGEGVGGSHLIGYRFKAGGWPSTEKPSRSHLVSQKKTTGSM